MAQRLANSFNAPLSHRTRRRKAQHVNTRINYYEGGTESEDDFEVDEDTIVVDCGPRKKRKTIVVDSDTDEELPLAKLSVAKEDGPAGKLFRGLPTEVWVPYLLAIPSNNFTTLPTTYTFLPSYCLTSIRNWSEYIQSITQQIHPHVSASRLSRLFHQSTNYYTNLVRRIHNLLNSFLMLLVM